MKVSKSMWVGWISIPVALFVVIFFATGNGMLEAAGQYDEFAQCLAEEGVTMYGAYWCPHCMEQKQMFGASWNHVNYVECSLSNKAGITNACSDANIKAYPTWEFQNGLRIEGEIPFEKISSLSGCKIDQ